MWKVFMGSLVLIGALLFSIWSDERCEGRMDEKLWYILTLNCWLSLFENDTESFKISRKYDKNSYSAAVKVVIDIVNDSSPLPPSYVYIVIHAWKYNNSDVCLETRCDELLDVWKWNAFMKKIMSMTSTLYVWYIITNSTFFHNSLFFLYICSGTGGEKKLEAKTRKVENDNYNGDG